MERAPAQDTSERLVSDMIFAVANFIIKSIQARDSLFLRAPATFGFLVSCMQVVGWEHWLWRYPRIFEFSTRRGQP